MEQEPGSDDPRSTSPLQVDVQRGARATVVVVGGEVDMVSAERMREAMFAELRRGPDLLVVDLTAVTFFPSTAIAALALLQREAEDSGVPLRVVANTRSVVRPLEVTEVYDDLLVHSSRAEALAAGASTAGSVPARPEV